ncbi:hypothetical protein CAEBREN_18451 [Caenorhabditis brenneri]|uniref:Uncharacterized protein n=1 Tax=Caenorhabditis brenneri TaxID=135651 RepID=G0P8F5_CAEBE|nr:hypothetical protein CAEBREN_18451 [Caenorhabditis brenneri]
MSQPNDNPVPTANSQVVPDQAIGRKIIGPFKRFLDKQVKEAGECVRVSEVLIQDYISDQEKEPSLEDVKLFESFINRLHKQRKLMEALPGVVESKLNLPEVIASSRRETFASEIQVLLEKVEYLGTVHALEKTIEMYEQVFTSRGIQMEISPVGTIRTATDIESAEEEGESKKGSSTLSPKTINSTHGKFVYDEVDYLDRSADIDYIRELEARATAMASNDKISSRDVDKLNPIPTVPSGPNDSVVSIENTILIIKIAGTPSLPKTPFLSPSLSEQDKEYMANIGIYESEFKLSRNQHKKHIDMILGADIISWIQSLETTTRHILPSKRLMETTPFGYLIHPTPKLDLLFKTIETIGNSSTDEWDDVQTVMTLLDKSEPNDPIERYSSSFSILDNEFFSVRFLETKVSLLR